MKQTKRLLALLLCALLLVPALCLPASAASVVAKGACGKNTVWTLNNAGTLTVSGKGSIRDYTYTDPAPWSDYQHAVKKLVVKAPVSRIGEGAFSMLTMLKSVSVASSVKEVGGNAMPYCDWWENQKDGPVYLGTALYAVKGQLKKNTTLTIKKGTTSITDFACYYQPNLVAVSIPDSVKSIGPHAFGNTGLSTVSIGKNVSELSGKAFQECKKFVAFLVSPDNRTYRADENGVLLSKDGSRLIAYPTATPAKNYTVPESVKAIGESAFMFATKLKTVSLPDTLETIEPYAFSNSRLAKINVPSAIRTVGACAFEETPWLKTRPDGVVYFGKTAVAWAGEMPEETVVTLKDGTTAIAGFAFQNQQMMLGVKIPDSVKTIGRNAFMGCSFLPKVKLPKDLTKLETSVFESCDRLKSVTLPKNLTAIDERAFMQCGKLKKLTLPAALTAIGDMAFAYSGLQSLDLPKTVTKLGVTPFYEAAIQAITVNVNNQRFASDANGVLYDADYAALLCYPACKGGESYKIPATVRTIGEGAFAANRYLIQLTIPKTVRKIGKEAFAFSKKLAAVKIAGGVTTIAPSAFYYCPKLRTVTTGTALRFLGDNAFAYCSKLKSVTLPKTLRFLGNGVFYDCGSLQSVVIKSQNALIVDTRYIFPEQIKICAPADSTAKTYARKYGYTFKAL